MWLEIVYRVVQLNFTTEIKVFNMSLIDVVVRKFV